MSNATRQRYARHELMTLRESQAVKAIPVGHAAILRAQVVLAKVSRGRNSAAAAGRTHGSNKVELPSDLRGKLAAVQDHFAKLQPKSVAAPSAASPATSLEGRKADGEGAVQVSRVAVVSRRAASSAIAKATREDDKAIQGSVEDRRRVRSASTGEGDAAAAAADSKSQRAVRDHLREYLSRYAEVIGLYPPVLTPDAYFRAMGLPSAAPRTGSAHGGRRPPSSHRHPPLPGRRSQPSAYLNPSACAWQPSDTASGPSPATHPAAAFVVGPKAIGADFVLPLASVRPRRVVPPIAPDVFVFQSRSSKHTSRALLAVPPREVASAVIPSVAVADAVASRRGRSSSAHSHQQQEQEAARQAAAALVGTGRRRVEDISGIQTYVLTALPGARGSRRGGAAAVVCSLTAQRRQK